MRLFLLPISTTRSLIYCQRLNKQLSAEPSRADKIITKASSIWLQWEKAGKGWKKKVTTYGNKLFERIPHEEWGLKSVPPLSQRRKDEELQGRHDVEVSFPAAFINEEGVKDALKAFAGQERQRFHSKWMWWSIVGIPATTPVALIPAIPNLPFFYLVFRAWSHWKARAGSQHVDFLLGRRLFKFRSSPELDLGYAFGELDGALDASIKKSKQQLAKVQRNLIKKSDETISCTEDSRAERLLLTRSSGKIIANLVGVPELEEQVQRAVKQVEKALRTKRSQDKEKQEHHRTQEEDKTKR